MYEAAAFMLFMMTLLRVLAYVRITWTEFKFNFKIDGAMTLGMATFGIMTLSIDDLIVALSMNYTQNNDTQHCEFNCDTQYELHSE